MSITRYSLDTSVAIRILTGKPESQFNVAMDFLREATDQGHCVCMDDLVLAESYYALQAYYKMPKDKALDALRQLSESGSVQISDTAKTVLGITNLGSAKPGFVDRLIHGASQRQNHKLITFEKAAQKLSNTQVLGEG